MTTGTPTASDRPDRRNSKRGAATRARLVTAAKEIFERDGFLEARITDISERAELSHGSFYHYFDSKDRIFLEVTETAITLLSEPLHEVILNPAVHAVPEERIRRGIHRFLESYQREVKILRVIEQVSRIDERIRAIRDRQRQQDHPRLVRSVRTLQERDLADRRLDADRAITVLGAMVDGFAEAWLVQAVVSCTLDEAADQLTRLFANGLGLRPAAGDRPA